MPRLINHGLVAHVAQVVRWMLPEATIRLVKTNAIWLHASWKRRYFLSFLFVSFFPFFSFFDQRTVRTFRCVMGEPQMASWAKTHPIDAVLNQFCRDFHRNGTWRSAFLPRVFMHTLTLLTWICSILFYFSVQGPVFIVLLPRAVETFVAVFLLHAERSSQSVLCTPAKPTANVTFTNPPKRALSIYDQRPVESFLSFLCLILFCFVQCRDIFATFLFFFPFP